MPFSSDKVMDFDSIYNQYADMEDLIHHEKFFDFIWAFQDHQYDPKLEDDLSPLERPELNGINIINMKHYSHKVVEFIWSSFDIKQTGSINRQLTFYAINGLSGHVQDFQLKVFFRVLDTDRDGKLTSNQMRTARRLVGSKFSEDQMMQKFQKKLGRPVENINYPTYYFLFKSRETLPNEDAYDMFDNFEEGGCCLLL